MNNYCTNCGNKLNEKDIKCSNCGTYVIDEKKSNSSKIFKIILTVLGIIILAIIIFLIGYHLYYKNINKKLYKEYLKEDYPNAKFVKYQACYKCDGSCDGSCINSKQIVGCYRYYYKSESSLDNYDIILYNNKGDVSVDIYSVIVNKYNFDERNSYDDDEDKYLTAKRSFISVYIDDIPENIEQIYNMVNELFDAYKLDTRRDIEISIYNKDYDYLTITNKSVGPRTVINWDFSDFGGLTAYDPDLKTVKDRLGIKDTETSNEETTISENETTTTEEDTVEND